MSLYKNLELKEKVVDDIYEKSLLDEEELKNLKIIVFQNLLAHDPLKTRNTTEIIVKYILEHYYIKTIMDDISSEMYLYQEGIYVPNGESFIKEICREILEKAYTGHIANEVIEKIKADTYIKEEEFRSQESKNIYQIPVQNGILEIKKNELYPFEHTKTFLQKIPIKYDKKADCPAIKKFISEIVGNDEDYDEIQELFGYLLLKEYKFEQAWMFCGTGRNGKGKLIGLMKNFLGAQNCVNLSLQDLDKDQYSCAELYGKMACLGADISNESLKETATFKSATGRDMLSPNRKFKTRINFINYAKMIFSSNELPSTKDLSPAFFKRWRIIDFPFIFYPKNEYDQLENKVHAKICDTAILEKISTPEEMSGLLNWSLEGLQRLLEREDFTKCRTTESIKKLWLRKSDSFDSFFNDCLKLKEDAIVGKKKLKTTYVKYCNFNKLRVRADSHIKSYLENKGVIDKREQSMAEEQYFWDGIEINDEIVNQANQAGYPFTTLGRIDEIPYSIKMGGLPGLPGYDQQTGLKNYEKLQDEEVR